MGWQNIKFTKGEQVLFLCSALKEGSHFHQTKGADGETC